MCSTGLPRPGAGQAGRARLQRRARATRQAILTTAAEHFARDGYHATTLEHVMAEVGATKGALYFHFASKEALARAVIAEMVQRWRDLRGELRERGLDPLSGLLTLVDGIIDNPIARGGTRLLGELPPRGPDPPGHFGFGEHDVAELLDQAARSGLLRHGIEPTALARQIVALIAGHRQICHAGAQRQDLRRRIDEAWVLLLPAIATDTWLAGWGSRRTHGHPGMETYRA